MTSLTHIELSFVKGDRRGSTFSLLQQSCSLGSNICQRCCLFTGVFWGERIYLKAKIFIGAWGYV